VEGPEGKKFVMVRQWRHGVKEISLEFPGGVFEPGENAAEAAARELQEETAFKAGKIQKIGEFNPNPAIMSNRVHFFLAEDLQDTGKQDLDEDEYVEVELVSRGEVFRNLGKPPYIHALMGTAFALYLQKTASENNFSL
jgi:8-oxo-dGTP pyrophosphatase MutT (NUDIX family)